MEGEIPKGASFGRYVILDKIGAGGMGVVYQAFDPELDRKVALKLVRVDRAEQGTRGETEGRERLLREAQAMAKLAHPNVISVFDVGALGDRVYVAMEFVDGMDLATWLKTPHPWEEILGRFLQAGRGLAAAHQARLIHRDFKPDNVLVGNDGRVRVVDFGLARALGPAGEVAAHERVDVSRLAAMTKDSPITRTGALMGTPLFMSPEQHLGLVVDPRTDQFSFCVALHEALYGMLPFPGTTYKELAAAVLAGKLVPPPARTKVPGWVRKALVRGLSVKPADRYDSMEDLLRALGRDPGLLRHRVMVVSLIVALAVAGVIGFLQNRRGGAPVCQGAAEQLRGVWDDNTRTAAETAFARAHRPYAKTTFASVAGVLDRYAAQWSEMRTSACEATQRGEQSAELLDVRMACLDERREALRALGGMLAGAGADETLVDRAIQAATGLPRLSECASAELLAEGVRPPEPAQRARVTTLRAQIAQANVLEHAAKIDDGLALAKSCVSDAQALGYRPVLGEALLVLGDLQGQAGDYKTAEKTLREAARAAQAGRDSRTAASALLSVALIAGDRLAMLERGMDDAANAQALAASLGDDPAFEGDLADVRGRVLEAAGKHEDALPVYAHAVELLEKARPDSIALAAAENDLGGAYRRVHKYDLARTLFGRAMAMREKILGPDHPAVASSVLNLGNVYFSEGKYADALPYYRRALAMREKVFGPDHPEVAEALVRLADALGSLGQHEEARTSLERALAIEEHTLGPEHPELGDVLNELGDVYKATGKNEQALATYQRALALKEKSLGPEHASVAISVYSVGQMLIALKRYDEAVAALSRALAIDTKAHGADSPELAYDLTGLGEAYLAAARPADALAPLRRALALREPLTTSDPTEIAETRFMLARAMWDANQDRPAARKMAETARAVFAGAGPGLTREAGFIAKWLEEHQR